MKRTFTTVMPDRIGAFLGACTCLGEFGLNITRVSYNKAVDVHMLFIEAEGNESSLDAAEEGLRKLGYISNEREFGGVLLVEFRLRDEPGRLVPILELIKSYSFNISYMSSSSDGRSHQNFKIGLYVEDGEAVAEFMHRASLICSLRILEYSKSERVLDNTVFYLSFADEIAEGAGLDEVGKNELIVNSNLIMQMLDEAGNPPYKTFDYIGKFAEAVRSAKGTGFNCRVSRHPLPTGAEMLIVEPPCGSNVTVIRHGGRLLFVDSGFLCLSDELWGLLQREIPDLENLPRELILTHADVDHCGCADRFDRIYASERCLENFLRENRDEAAWREENPKHAPYAKISKLLTSYVPPKTDSFSVIGNAEGDSLLTPIGRLAVCGFDFEVYEGAGGHAPGEIVLVDRECHAVFSGDIFINVKGCTPEQTAFNRLAPYLMTSVDTDPDLARRERQELMRLLGHGSWTIFGGHGAPYVAEL